MIRGEMAAVEFATLESGAVAEQVLARKIGVARFLREKVTATSAHKQTRKNIRPKRSATA